MQRTTKTQKLPELLAPVGDFEMLHAAIEAGADAIYFGVKKLNMRATAKNFAIEELPQVISTAHKSDIKTYLTLNTIIYEEELGDVRSILKTAKDAGIDAIICWDFAVINEARKLGLEIHISTQASISNSASASFYHSLGAKRCVLARECSLEQIKEIRSRTRIEIEVFIHGAMCVSVSGRCFLSQFLYGRSANRGDCLQPCRRAYETYLIRDKQTEKELILGNDYVLSPKDLCTLPFLDKIVPYVDALKIEGRVRGPEYVYITAKTYREALNRIANDNFDREFVNRGMEELAKVYNRGFSDGFFMGKPINSFTQKPNSQATRRKKILGKITNYFSRVSVAEVQITANSIKVGDEIVITGPTTGVVIERINSIEKDHLPVEEAHRGEKVGIKISKKVRRNDSVFIWEERHQKRYQN